METADAEAAGQTEESATAAEPATVESTTDAVEPPSDAKTEDKPAEEKVTDTNKYFLDKLFTPVFQVSVSTYEHVSLRPARGKQTEINPLFDPLFDLEKLIWKDFNRSVFCLKVSLSRSVLWINTLFKDTEKKPKLEGKKDKKEGSVSKLVNVLKRRKSGKKGKADGSKSEDEKVISSYKFLLPKWWI